MIGAIAAVVSFHGHLAVALPVAALLAFGGAPVEPCDAAAPTDATQRTTPTSDRLRLRTQRRKLTEGKPYRRRLEVIRKDLDWDPAKTAVILIDVWAEHPCKMAQRRAGELARYANTVIAAARARGVMIVHAPSGGTHFYNEPKYRARIDAAPRVAEPFKIEAWRHLDPNREPPLPIDDRDGGCDDEVPPDRSVTFDRHINPAIQLQQGDVVSASGSEIYRLFKHEGIENVVVMGVHTNMCVLGRPFGIRNLVDLGFNVVLARDLTDALYDPRDRPYVSHNQGVQLVVEHIEEHWCPTIRGYDLIR
jgi:nicotinamidase-related amidase